MVEILAPAKLNLFLEVLARRDDGFHEIETLMTAITIFDRLRFSANSTERIDFTCAWGAGIEARAASTARRQSDKDESSAPLLGDLPQGADNIVVRAVEKLRTRAGIRAGATIQLVKQIPSAAGLGGASSDAAAALVAANKVWEIGWSSAQLAELSAELGSDIPFFFAGGAAICRGRGERLESTTLPTMHVVVVRPPIGLSTPEVYRHCQVPDCARSSEALLRSAAAGDIAGVGQQLSNRLQQPAQRLSPWIDRVSKEFARVDCLGHQMTGSGSSYFGICRNARHARRVSSRLRAANIGLVYCATNKAAPHRRE